LRLSTGGMMLIRSETRLVPLFPLLEDPAYVRINNG
jgi:hypothetical protein